MEEWNICIWCRGDSYRVDSEQNSLWINGCDRSDWTEYKCEVCGCRFLSVIKHINFDKILEEGNPDLQKIDYIPIQFAMHRRVLGDLAEEIGLTRELYDKRIWYICSLRNYRSSGMILEWTLFGQSNKPNYGLYVSEEYIKEHRLEDNARELIND